MLQNEVQEKRVLTCIYKDCIFHQELSKKLIKIYEKKINSLAQKG